jgi:single-strand selective monofunctional uracil DNA glycosylase
LSLKQITDRLNADLEELTFGRPVTHVYNPHIYARAPWDQYCDRFGGAAREVLMLGMNPGPWGMSQVGVPFGEIAHVRDWLGIDAPVGRPPTEHPKRPIEGFGCPRSEVSGRRLWGWAKECFGTPEAFFSRFFVTSYCPLVFMEESGRNRVPEKLPRVERDPLFAACDRALRGVVEHFQPTYAIGIGKFAEKRLRAVVGDLDLTIASVPHPSPASPLANRGWSPLINARFEELGIELPRNP